MWHRNLGDYDKASSERLHNITMLSDRYQTEEESTSEDDNMEGTTNMDEPATLEEPTTVNEPDTMAATSAASTGETPTEGIKNYVEECN